MAWLGSAEDLGEMAGPIVTGLIWSLWGIPVVMIVRALLGIATEVYALRLDRRDVLVTGQDNQVATDSIAGSRDEPNSQRPAAPRPARRLSQSSSRSTLPGPGAGGAAGPGPVYGSAATPSLLDLVTSFRPQKRRIENREVYESPPTTRNPT
jgi:hypothetical protein